MHGRCEKEKEKENESKLYCSIRICIVSIILERKMEVDQFGYMMMIRTTVL